MDQPVQARWSSDCAADREQEIRDEIRLEQEGIKQAQDTAMMHDFTSLRPVRSTAAASPPR